MKQLRVHNKMLSNEKKKKKERRKADRQAGRKNGQT